MDRQTGSDGDGAPCQELPQIEAYLAKGEARGLNWTSLRQQVLELLWRDGKPRGAYALAEEMRAAGNGIYPNSLYRILDTLEEAGLIVSIATSRRVQIAPDPEERDWVVLQCSACQHSELVPFSDRAEVIRGVASQRGHTAGSLVLECIGLCRSCARLPK